MSIGDGIAIVAIWGSSAAIALVEGGAIIPVCILVALLGTMVVVAE